MTTKTSLQYDTFRCRLTVASLAIGLGLLGLSAQAASVVVATGGDEVFDIPVNDVPYRVHVFTNTGTANFTVTTGGGVEYLIIAGGGGGGANPTYSSVAAGGGGAGGLISNLGGTLLEVSPTGGPDSDGIYPVTVGGGGLGRTGTSNGAGQDGTNSTFAGLVALGGGGGGANQQNGRAGGSGGGASGQGANSRVTLGGVGLQTNSASGGHGHNGGGGTGAGLQPGGGGGAGGIGADSNTGGDGMVSSISGATIEYATGGAGALNSAAGFQGVAGTPGTGNGGGGGGRSAGATGGDGGSGVVIIRYSLESFLPADPFTVVNIETGSDRFTGSNAVELADFPVPEGYDRFQITADGGGGAVDPDGWVSTNAADGYRVEFTRPVADTNIALYAWFTNATEAVELRRAVGRIFYTTVEPPDTSVRPAFSRERLPGANLVVFLSDLDLGSTGGEADGREMDVYARAIMCVNPGDDLTPDEPYVTLGAEGDYPLLLWIKNEAGNEIASASLVTVAASSSGSTNRWTGAGDADLWHDAFNWSAGLPIAGQAALIGAGPASRLTNTTPTLASLTIADNTLVFNGWDTRLRAGEVVVRSNAVVTHARNTDTNGTARYYESWTPNNRVYIECENFTLDAGGGINVNGMGYQRPEGRSTDVWGNGPGAAYDRGGAGHGGKGGRGNEEGYAGLTIYGDIHAPLDPGSSSACAISSSGSGNTPLYSHGGGVVRIAASGIVTVRGEISANGFSGTYRAGGGSGGSIYVTCREWRGDATGLLQANGGNGPSSYGGGGAGGRIAVHYNPETQTDWPGVRFSTRFGTGWSWPYTDSPGGRGTLSLSDFRFLDTSWDGLFDQTVLYVTNGVREWQATDLTVSNNSLLIGHTNFNIRIANNLTLDNATLGVLAHSTISVGGNLSLKGSATLSLDAGATNPPSVPYGAELDVGGTATLTGNSWIRPVSEPDNGGAPLLRMRNLDIAADSGIDANNAGFRAGISHGYLNYLPLATSLDIHGSGPGAAVSPASSSDTRGGGGGHGGQGGRSNLGLLGGPTNGLPFAPSWPGSGSVCNKDAGGGHGGGLVRLTVSETLTLHGVIRANGGGGSYRGGGGAGGALFVDCQRFVSSTEARLQANGANAGQYSGGGGGGRIAVWIGASPAIVALYGAGGSKPGVRVKEPQHAFLGEVSVAQGTGYDSGVPGTCYFLTVFAGTLFSFW